MPCVLFPFPLVPLARAELTSCSAAQDAILGLDDLRGAHFSLQDDLECAADPAFALLLAGWTLRGAIQPSIPIYLTQETFTEVSRVRDFSLRQSLSCSVDELTPLELHSRRRSPT